MNKNTLLRWAVIASTLFSLSAWGCGCVDAPNAVIAKDGMNANYFESDTAFANSLNDLGTIVKRSYESMSVGAEDAEKIARLKKEQALVMKGVSFQLKKNSDLIGVSNEINALSSEANLNRSEKKGVLKASILNEKSFMEE